MATGGQREIGDDLDNVGKLTPEKLHRTVLNRCLPNLMKDLNVQVLMIYIQQGELFDEVTIRDINEQTTTTYKILHLIDQIKKRDQHTYVRFKECLIWAQQEDLKIMLDEEEENLAAEMKGKHRGVEASKVESQMQAGAKKELDEPQTKEELYFLASHMLQKEAPEEIISPKPNSQMESSPVLCYVFTGNFLPSAIFHRLVAACIAHWPVAKKKKEHTEENLIFSGCCVFQLDEQHKLTLLFREHVIFLRVTRMGIKYKTPSSKLCNEVRKFITTNLEKIIGYLGKGLKFEYYIQCPEYNGVSINSLIPVSRLKEEEEVCCAFDHMKDDHMIESSKVLDFWFEDQVKNTDCQDTDDVDTRITQEHINHARLCNALTTVCSNALREILLTNVPMPHTDIYKAILANQANLKKKLNKEQVPLVFPDLQGLSTGKVEEFDITLLYAIIRNVSSVPDPSNEWGKPPADNPRDTSLRANVDRIRSYRNHIVGHNVHGKISQQEFEDYWAKIDEVIREIEIVIGNHGYLKDLEDIKNQAFTTQEARELRKKFQEYKRKTNAAAADIMSTLEQAISRVEKLRAKELQGTVIPAEILNMDDRSIQLFENALKDGKVKVYSIRVMVVGHQGVGKTTLIKRLLGKDVNISERRSTEGIDVHLHCCDVSISSHEWILQKKGSEQDHLLQRVAKVLKEQIQVPSEAADEKRVVIPQEGQKTNISTQDHVPEDPNLVSPHPDLGNLPKSNTNTMVRSEPRKNVASESRTMDSNIEFLQFVQENADKIKLDLGKYAPLTMWDFAGHHAFYTTHQMFLSRRAIYLLVSDISKRLDDMVKDEFFFDEKGKLECSVRELLDVWMNSIHSCAPSDKESMNCNTSYYDAIPPPVILVGTHADVIPQDNRHAICENYFKDIRFHLKDKPSSFHLVEEDFAINNNTVVDSKLESLKRKIVDVASQQLYWGETIPASWLPLEQVLMNLRAKGRKVIHRSLLEKINQARGVQISTDDLDLFLRFQHEIGTILYFSTELLKEKIVLEPQWMIKALKSLITAEELLVLRQLPRAVSNLWYEFKNDGKLSPKLIDALWTKDKNADLHDNKDHILLLMEELNIIAKPTLFIDDTSKIKEVNYYFAPCMLHAKPPKEVIFPEPHQQMESSSVMCYVFTGNFLPAPIFHRLIAACVAQWPLATKNMGTELKNQIFCGCGVFRIDQLHKLTLHFRNYIIFMRVTKQGISDKTPSSMLCIKVKEFIATVLKKIIGYLGHSLKFEEFIQCPEYSGEIVHCRIAVDRLKENEEICCDCHDKPIVSKKILKFWFDGQVKNIEDQDKDDVDAPITQEQINFARLCNALTTVCSNALRKILLTNVPMPHTDICTAILANKAMLKKKLKKDQVQLVYPGPQGLPTGKVDEFDISLLYTIIRNVSSVLAPSNGWGEPPIDNPRDTTLGASVERIRMYRNKASAHSPDGKIIQQKFEDYWANIDDVLREIEIVIGNHGYLEDLEKRKNQVITPHEARELQKKFQEHKRQTEAAASDIMSILEESDSAVETARQKVKEAKSCVKKLQDNQK